MVSIAEMTGTKHHKEDVVTSKIEEITSKIPSDVFLAAGVGAMAVSAGFALAGKTRWANFIGEWVPTILILGLYNKLVKLHDEE